MVGIAQIIRWLDIPSGRQPRMNMEELEEPSPGKDVFLGSAVINLLALALPITILQVYDRVLPNASMSTLTAFIIGLSAVVVIDTILKYARGHLLSWSGGAFVHNTSSNALGQMLRTPPPLHRKTPAAEHLDRLAAISGVGDFHSGAARIVLIDFLFIPVFAGVILLVGGWLFLLPMILFAVFGALAVRRTARLRELIEEREKTDARRNDFIMEILEAMPTVKALSMEPLMMRRFERLQGAVSEVVQKTVLLTTEAQTFGALYGAASTILIVGFGAIFVINGQMTLGGLACCMLLSSQLLQPLMRVLSAWNEFYLVRHRRDQVAELFENTAPLPKTTTAPVTKITVPASVTLDKVTIGHGNAEPLFDDLSLYWDAGHFIALQGKDGSGRSTLLRALTGSLAPQSGKIMIGDTVRTIDTVATIRASVRYVGQEPTLLRGTLLENISIFGRTNLQDCLWATKLIGLDSEIIRMPLGYDTPLESSAGRSLPAATAQRISIARALAMRPSVLILDESNTALDLPGEKALINALRHLKGQLTIIFSTHRPSIIRLADHVYYVGDGRVLEVDMPTLEQGGAA